MATGPEADSPSGSDAVMVISVWQGQAGFLGRLTMGQGDADADVKLVASPDELLESVKAWLSSLT